MRKKSIKMLLAVALMIFSFSYSHASVNTVNLDGIANAGYWADDLTSTYFYVKNKTTDSYYYQWRYGSPDALRWSNLNEVVTDLNTLGFEWWLESGGDPFNNPSSPIWTSIYLEKGLYDIHLAPDSAAYNLASYWGDNKWNNYVQIWADYNDSFNFGEGSYIANNANDSLNYYRTNVDGMTVSLKEDTNLYFYINDTNSTDNSGSVKLNVSVVPEPGQVLLFMSGAFPLVFWYQRKKVFSILKQAVHNI